MTTLLLGVVPTIGRGIGALEIILAGVVVLLWLFMGFRLFATAQEKRGGGPPFVLQEFWFSKTPENGVYAIIAGRPDGFIAWLMSAIGLGKDIRFEVTQRSVARSTHSLSMYFQQVVPLRHVASTQAGYSRSLGWIVLTAIFLSVGLLAVGPARPTAGFGIFANQNPDTAARTVVIIGIVFFALATVCFIAYWLSKRLLLAVESFGGTVLEVSFKPSLIENVPITLDEVQKVARLITILATGNTGTAT